MTTARILQLYPKELGVAGDRGNVLALAARLGAAGIANQTIEHHRGAEMPDHADIVVVGNGPLSAMRNVHADLIANAHRLNEWVAAGVPVFAYGSGAELLSHGIELLDGSTLQGLDIFPFRAKRVTERKVGYILTETAFGQLVGFEDNASVWMLDTGAAPLGAVSVGTGNGDGREGALSGPSVATQVGGPVLPLNPILADSLVASVAGRLGVGATEPDTTDLDSFALRAREVIIGNARHVFSRI